MVKIVALVSKHTNMQPNRCVMFACHAGLMSILFYMPATKYPRK